MSTLQQNVPNSEVHWVCRIPHKLVLNINHALIKLVPTVISIHVCIAVIIRQHTLWLYIFDTVVLCDAIGNSILSELFVPEPLDKRPPTWLSLALNVVCLIQPESDHSIKKVIIWKVPHGREQDTQY